MHHRAWQNEYFVRAYAAEPLAFCRKCHAPGADPKAEPTEAAREAGVGCTTCHVVPAGIVGVHAMAAKEGGHEVLGDARIATTAACASCHEFAFPGPPGADVGRMQDTLGEHARSAASTSTCQDCHMPRVRSTGGGAHRGHDFRVQGDREAMAKAVVVEKAEIHEGELHLDLAPGAIGHAFPTGDLHRRVEVRAAALDAKGRELGESREVLGRTFGPVREGRNAFVPAERSDTRLVGRRSFVFPLPKGAQKARYRVVWQRLPPAMAQSFGMKMSDHEMVVLEGIVGP